MLRFSSMMGFSSVKAFGVIGSGQMGTGIAIVASRVAKLPVTIYDSNEISLKKSEEFVNNWLKKEQSKNRISDDEGKDFLSRFKFSTSIQAFKDADTDFLVEAIIENTNVKKSVLGAADKLLKPSAIIASNTSSISITDLASATSRPSQVIGMHFMNPVPVMKLV